MKILPIIINDSGKYYLEIEFDDLTIKQEFVVRQNHSGISLDSMVYPVPWGWVGPPLKQLNSGVHYNEIHCRDGQLLVLKNGRTFPACVNPDTIPKLFERNWALPEVSVIDLNTRNQESKTINITGIINRFDTHEGFEYQFIPLQKELPRITYTGYDTINLLATSEDNPSIHQKH